MNSKLRKIMSVITLGVLGVSLYFTSIAAYRAASLVDVLNLSESNRVVLYLRYGLSLLAQLTIGLYLVGQVVAKPVRPKGSGYDPGT